MRMAAIAGRQVQDQRKGYLMVTVTKGFGTHSPIVKHGERKSTIFICVMCVYIYTYILFIFISTYVYIYIYSYSYIYIYVCMYDFVLRPPFIGNSHCRVWFLEGTSLDKPKSSSSAVQATRTSTGPVKSVETSTWSRTAGGLNLRNWSLPSCNELDNGRV